MEVSTGMTVWMSATLEELVSLTQPIKVTKDNSLHMLLPGVRRVQVLPTIPLIIRLATIAHTEVECLTITQ